MSVVGRWSNRGGEWVAVAALLLAVATRVSAQAAPAVRGVVYDSLARKPLADATVRVTGGSAMARTDEKGRFRLDSVAAGPVELAVEHPRLDSIGLYELSARVVHDGKHEHKLGVPSFATLSAAICGRSLPADSAVMYGSVKTPESAPAAFADVVVSWLGVTRTADGKLGQRRVSYATRTDSLGRYAACGLPADEPYTLAAKGSGPDSLATLALDLGARSTPVQLHDVMLSAPLTARAAATPNDSVAADSTGGAPAPRRATGPTGVIRGVVQGPGGEPVPNTRVAIADLADVRTDSAGTFLMLDVPTGSRQIEAIAVGRNPAAQLITVRARDTLAVTFTLERVSTLREVRTETTVLTEFTRNYDERKRLGIGKFRDSTEMGSSPSLVAALSAFPSVMARTGLNGIPVVLLPKLPSIVGGAGQCVARLYVDGRPEQWERVVGMRPEDLAWMEVYARASILPAEFQVATIGDACGVVSLVTKARVAK